LLIIPASAALVAAKAQTVFADTIYNKCLRPTLSEYPMDRGVTNGGTI
jgi:hypothetical protein